MKRNLKNSQLRCLGLVYRMGNEIFPVRISGKGGKGEDQSRSQIN
jgi:hypothetical protein